MGSRLQRREAFIFRISEPEIFEDICDRISDGATLSDIAREMNANYRWVYSWFHDTDFPERAEAFEIAKAARDSLMKEDVIGQIHRLATMDIREAFDDAGNLKAISNIPEHLAKGISSIDTSYDQQGVETKKIKFVDRGQMLALGGRRQKMFVDKVEMSGQMSLEQAVMESVKPRE
jgi:hypothetical protein